MASTLPTVSDCCSMCEGLSVTLTNTGAREIYQGNGDPNDAGLVPDLPAFPAAYQNLDVPGETWWWSVADQVWI